MSLPWRRDEEAVRRDKATLKAWESGIISVQSALIELRIHNGWRSDQFSEMSEEEMIREFNGLGYVRGLSDDGNNS